MTLCETITKIIIRMVEEEGKNLDEIANEMCPKIEYGREKIIRIIKDFLGEEYLIQHAETLKYDVGKAELAKKRKHRAHEKIDAGADSVVEPHSATPVCQTTVQAVSTEQMKEPGQMKGEPVIEVDMPASCCHKAVRKVRKTVSENITEETGETKGQEQVLEEQDDTPVIKVPQELFMEIKRLIGLYSLEEVKAALDIAERDN